MSNTNLKPLNNKVVYLIKNSEEPNNDVTPIDQNSATAGKGNTIGTNTLNNSRNQQDNGAVGTKKDLKITRQSADGAVGTKKDLKITRQSAELSSISSIITEDITEKLKKPGSKEMIKGVLVEIQEYNKITTELNELLKTKKNQLIDLFAKTGNTGLANGLERYMKAGEARDTAHLLEALGPFIRTDTTKNILNSLVEQGKKATSEQSVAEKSYYAFKEDTRSSISPCIGSHL